jgi:hypothetical protein
MTEGTINVNVTLGFDPDQLKLLLTTFVVMSSRFDPDQFKILLDALAGQEVL